MLEIPDLETQARGNLPQEESIAEAYLKRRTNLLNVLEAATQELAPLFPGELRVGISDAGASGTTCAYIQHRGSGLRKLEVAVFDFLGPTDYPHGLLCAIECTSENLDQLRGRVYDWKAKPVVSRLFHEYAFKMQIPGYLQGGWPSYSVPLPSPESPS
ncbi:MAG: hypothetical protein V1735_02860 [Nanoarchaeota archaeon]